MWMSLWRGIILYSQGRTKYALNKHPTKKSESIALFSLSNYCSFIASIVPVFAVASR
ncbi:hypothetical protein [Moraxella lacunata]|uniref:hypothetical protein n=1 Tax=Moraxella lacunata TaxID=477 RepID=UPI003EE1386C